MDLAVFKRDVFFENDHSNPIFKKGKEYEILSEDKEFIYVNSKPKTNECSQVPKDVEGFIFKFK
ncbi:hypothetical protein MOF05_21380 [Bacillus haynesii]|uniref:hypothetical protein n=1 Tax=Bacillus haynesii TaxID=1925021 RepID=UPI002282C0D1|nr:hypothetical protein [Bacillus haynesii]MCY9156293.1 hypothetical protein [Bacillus haynesii]MCY9290903.1 hypothetical protein [Bacillus haynesii]MCY9451744.1 hypothetical protein [Bacillus haynesii]